MTGARRFLWILAGVAAVATVVILVWFQPQKLLMDDSTDEAVPGVVAGGDADPEMEGIPDKTPPAEPEGPKELATGTFANLDHEASGRAILLETADGTRYLRFEDFEVENGPDLRVYLSDASDGSYSTTFVDLGALKGNIGDQNYEIPDDIDITVYNSAVIWCRRFSSGFAVAEVR